MRVLITGGAGFIGSALTALLSSLNHKVYVMDALIESTYAAKVKENRWIKMKDHLRDVVFIRHNLVDKVQIPEISNLDAIIHLAAVPGLDLSWHNLKSYTDNNIIATKNVIDLAISYNARLVHISTSSVYGDYVTGNEDQICSPVSPYGVTKLAAEHLIRAYALNTNLNYTILRLFSIYGPGQRPDMGYEIFIHKILNNQTIKVYGDGSAKRSNTYIADCLNAINLSLNAHSKSQTINIAGKELISVEHAIETMSKILTIKPKVEFSLRRKGDQLFTSSETHLAESELKWESTTEFELGIYNQIEICKKNKCQESAFKLFAQA